MDASGSDSCTTDAHQTFGKSEVEATNVHAESYVKKSASDLGTLQEMLRKVEAEKKTAIDGFDRRIITLSEAVNAFSQECINTD